MNYIGIDHHRQYSHITLLDEKGEKLKSGRVSNLRSELENFLSGIEEVKAVVEAGRSSYTMVDLLDEIGIDVTISHPKEVKAIVEAKIKTDKRDSWMLAHLLRTDLIPEVYKRSRENRESQPLLKPIPTIIQLLVTCQTWKKLAEKMLRSTSRSSIAPVI